MFDKLKTLSLTIVVVIITGICSCVQEGPVEKPSSKPEEENPSFLSITLPGVYSGTDSQTPVAVRTYESGVDQTSFSKSSSSRAWSIFNLSNGSYVTIKLSALSVTAGSTLAASVNMNGEVSTDSLTVVKTSGSNAWLENKKSKLGYIITLQ